ncbi:MAG: iron export ABC transporter permease subunit FetB [Myxococcota bacterium]
MNGAQLIPWWGLVGAAALIAVNGGLSVWLQLGLERKLLIASVRTVVQLLALGFVLVPVFRANSMVLVLAWGLAMVVLASWEATRRTRRRYRGMFMHAFVAMFLGATLTSVLGVAVLIGVEPWWQPRYFIPILGMILGNTLTGVALGMDRSTTILDESRGRVEAMLAFGATRWEALRPVATESLRTGMVPILNAMSVVGLVTIPGMMTGQLLGGSSPQIAARYQILIMFLVAATIAMATATVVILGLYRMIDRQHRLRVDLLKIDGV